MSKPSEDFLGTSEYEEIIYVIEIIEHAFSAISIYVLFRFILENSFIDCFHDPIMQYVLGGSLHKNNTIYLPLGLYHASVN